MTGPSGGLVLDDVEGSVMNSFVWFTGGCVWNVNQSGFFGWCSQVRDQCIISPGVYCGARWLVATDCMREWRFDLVWCIGILVEASHGSKDYCSSDGSLKRLHVTHSDDEMIKKYGLILQGETSDFTFAGILAFYCILCDGNLCADGFLRTFEDHTLMAQKVSGITGVSWTCVIVNQRTQRATEDLATFSIDEANSRLYTMAFSLATVIYLLAFSYKREFKATDVGVGVYEDTDVIERMQKVMQHCLLQHANCCPCTDFGAIM